ncbi:MULTISPECIES: hypothetical protein [unclassified Amycolatopsis]|uniref:hypothetical protein n=1 Tax=unclassified Amycolatopsis TaxID=2618356 RepID=UPI0028747A28|nr:MULTISPECIES: hypothetical protein [unclassified Amycolatopsis]MDS0138442.1 hypothetical protein [Amycolatopsis sp. 505]MDS0146281.1 hypothetical protein [Amycolatopsis sp. CM201R]
MDEQRKRLRGPRAVLVGAAGLGVIAGLTLRTAEYPGMLPPGTPDPELDLGLRLVCAAAVLIAVTLAYLTFARHQDEPLAMASLPGLVVTGVVLRHLVVTLPGVTRIQPAARVVPGAGAWVLLVSGVAMTATGLAAAFAARRAG